MPYLVTTLVAYNNEQGALPSLDPILYQGPNTRVHFLLHRDRDELSLRALFVLPATK